MQAEHSKISVDMRSKLARAKGLGAAHHGVEHWWRLRLTALALVPLSLWFVYSLLTGLSATDTEGVARWFASPVNALVVGLMMIAGFVHARLGVEEVVEDYVKGAAAKYTLLLLNTFLCYLLMALSVLAVLKLHFLDIASAFSLT